MRRWRAFSWRMVPFLLGLSIALTGCGTEEPRTPSAQPTQSPARRATGGGRAEWLAVFRAGPPRRLEVLTRELKREAGRNVAVSPVACWRGLARRLDVDHDTYVAGAVAESKGQITSVVSRVGRDPVFMGRVVLIACFD